MKINKFYSKLSETPEVDLEKLKPVSYNLNISQEVNTPSKWLAGSEPIYDGSTQPTQTQSSFMKRKREEDPWYIQFFVKSTLVKKLISIYF